jgi:ADP-heptose:LPS heptosyltransferase
VEGVNVYPHATLTRDYDDTAALVASCDYIVTMQTAVAHLAGALGVPCHVMVPETSQWRYAQPLMPWYTDNFVVHKRTSGNWDKVIKDIHADLGRLS